MDCIAKTASFKELRLSRPGCRASSPVTELTEPLLAARESGIDFTVTGALLASGPGIKLTCLGGPTMSALEGRADRPSWLDHFWF
jgi:hypothetical protein